ncbi:AGAP006112-PA, partial [Anopheles gambiae str. PEST]
ATMVLTAATTTSSASAIVPAPMTRYDRALPVNSMTEKRYSDRRLRPWPPTYNYGIPGGGGGGPGGGSAGSASGSAMLAMTTGGGGGGGGGKSRWMSAGLSDIGASLGGLRGSSAGSIYGGSVGGGVPQ